MSGYDVFLGYDPKIGLVNQVAGNGLSRNVWGGWHWLQGWEHHVGRMTRKLDISSLLPLPFSDMLQSM